MIKTWIEKLKALRIYAVRCSSFFYTGIKESKSQNVHYEFESADGGAWFTSGDEYLWEFTERWIYFLGLPIWRTYFKAENKGLYEV
jgi:hypothetical protein